MLAMVMVTMLTGIPALAESGEAEHVHLQVNTGGRTGYSVRLRRSFADGVWGMAVDWTVGFSALL